jgi:hypothetical protein
MRTTIRMNAELARRAKQYAARNNRTFTQVVEEAITQLLARASSAAPRPKIVLPTAGNARGPKMTEAQYRAMIEEMYDEEAERIWRAGRGPAGR